MQREKLKAEKGTVRNTNGKYLFDVPMTERAKALIHDEGWDRGNESWLAYRDRTEQERADEELKRHQMAADLALAYNEKYGLE